MKKKVLLMIVDALTKHYLTPKIDSGEFPNLKKLRDRSEAYTECYSIFPSVTHAALTSIVTGLYPYQHGVLGSHWFSEEQQEVPYFSAEWQIVAQMGLGTFLANFIKDLNIDYVKAETIFQTLAKQNILSSTINYFVYKGDTPHKLDLPFLLKLIPGLNINQDVVYGPHQLYLGDLLSQDGYPADFDLQHGGVSNWFGLRDEGTFDYLKFILRNDLMLPFTLAYFPKNDHVSHLEGPKISHDKLKDFDDGLGEVFEAAGGLEKFLETTTVLITGDHSQGHIASETRDASIDLEQLLSSYSIAKTGFPWTEADDLLVCPNMRTAVIYAKEHIQTSALVQLLFESEQIEQIIWRQDDDFVVQTHTGKVTFSRGGPYEDQFGSFWEISGDLTTLDVTLEDQRVLFGKFPNALERIEGALLHPETGRLWVTARPNNEFTVSTINPHLGGGSHGTLHAEDSVAPLLVAGCDRPDLIPTPARLVDLTPLCLKLLGASA